MLIIAGHASYIKGKIYEAPTNTLTEILSGRGDSYVHLRHSIDGQLGSVAYWRGAIERDQKLWWVLRRPSVLRYVTEIIGTSFYLLTRFRLRGSVYIGADPLNAFTGVILRKIGFFRRAVFYTADYATERFSSKLLNWFYHSLDRFCVRNADEVWNVSSRIMSVREKMGIERSKNVFVPNVPSNDYKKFIHNKKDRYCLITLGMVSEQLDFINLFEAIKTLEKRFPEISLKIVGNGPKEDEYKQLVSEMGIGKRVQFLGHLSHDDALDNISRSGIGLALYNGKWGFNYYGDSMKCREYLCFGLPVITTDTHSTVDEIACNNAGVVPNMDPSSYVDAAIKIWENYDEFSNNAIELSKLHDGVHTRVMDSLLQK